ncbi:L-ascorbate oxidase [Aspergillus steynii IBT 23096]|uniref:L-ascorbate oxidase n=1 Tax=Aspergillus steynii IBT 23096 TaxID=1392250 RepID=A0A2I2FV36_9EURO|nr:L-ascorbate oxidase [Aspergillus steynii IBT 23096]PLB44503.1 L-ascorbate oxidase [Aspergillus steynii IBT 23096]
MKFILAFQLLLLTLASCYTGVQQVRHDDTFQPHYILRVSEKEVSIACRSRLTALVNGTTPGPSIHLRENQTSWVRVYNDFTSDNLTMHWHGLSQSVAPYSDGTPQASQWPIKAQHYFDYELRPAVGEAGTYFYHSHVGFQAVSVTGPLIVEEQDKPPYEYDEERTIFLTELFNYTDSRVVQGITAPISDFHWPGEAASVLVNGKNYPGLLPNETNTVPPFIKANHSIERPCGPEVIKVKPDQTYRMRTIGGVALSPLVFGFEDHDNLTIIAADSHYTQPAETDMIQIGSGQRYDFLLRTKTEEELEKAGKSQFWIQIETRYRQQNNTFYALLSYETPTSHNQTIPTHPPTQKPVHLPISTQHWMEYTLQPLEDNNFPTADQVSRQIFLTSAQFASASGSVWTINNHTWTDSGKNQGSPTTFNRGRAADSPYLVQIYKEGERAIPDYANAVQNHKGWDPVFNVYPARVGEIVDIILINEPNGQNGGLDSHPWHIHGDHVYDLGGGSGDYNATENEQRLQGYRPVLRDTSFLFRYNTTGEDVGMGNAYTPQGWRAWRLRVENPGVWMIHCHTLQHMVDGMQAVMVMGNASEITRGTSPDLVKGYLSYGGDAYGNATHDPLVNHYFDE